MILPHPPLLSLSLSISRPSGTISLDGVCTYSPSGSRALQTSIRNMKLTLCSLCLSLFLSTLETTIVSTSLVSITDALHGFDQSGWVVTSYLLTYTGTRYSILVKHNLDLTGVTGFLIIYAKFSDIFGRKSMLLLAIVLFTAFSLACGLANNMLEL